jgi:hypothetical protein
MFKIAHAAVVTGAAAAALLAIPATAAAHKTADDNTIAVSNKVLADPAHKICVFAPVIAGTPVGSTPARTCHTKAEWEAQGVTVVAK